jgi:hypothetical protein
MKQPSPAPKATTSARPASAQAKSKKEPTSPWVIWTSGAIIVMAALATAYVIWWPKTPAPDAPPAEILKYTASERFAKLTPEQQQPYLKALRGLDRDERREAFQSASLTDDDRQRMRENMFNTYMAPMMDGYFALSDTKQREAYLDKLIDQQEARRREWARNRPSTRPAANAAQAGGNNNNAQAGRNGNRQRGAGRNDPARQKARIENTPPERQVKMAEFFAAMRARREARGMSNNWGGRGR